MKFYNKKWDSFSGDVWKREVDVRNFIQNNYTPYEGDDTFLVESTERTKKIWSKLTEMFEVIVTGKQIGRAHV